MSRTLNAAFVGLVVVIATGCAGPAAPVEQRGSCADMYGGQICTWSKTQGSALVEVGATVPIASIESAPADAPMAWPPVANARIDVPESARQQSGFTEMTVFWEAMGHPPGPYLTPTSTSTSI